MSCRVVCWTLHIIFLSSFYEIVLYMEQRYRDWTAIMRLFDLLAANLHWYELTDALIQVADVIDPIQRWNDCPNLVGRLFHVKLNHFIHDIESVNISSPTNSDATTDHSFRYFRKVFFRDYGCSVQVTEYQKRGLPHAHLLLVRSDCVSLFLNRACWRGHVRKSQTDGHGSQESHHMVNIRGNMTSL